MESRGKSVTKRHRKKWVDALSLVLPVLLFFAVLNCFTTYLYYQDYQCKMDILTEVAAGAETTGMDVAAGWLKGNDQQANEQGMASLNKTSTVITNQVKILIVQLTKNFLES